MGRASSAGWGGSVKTWISLAAIVAAAMAALLALGRSPICPCGHIALWHGRVQSPENSQQLSDWYSLTHLVHGFLFYAAARLALPRHSVAARLLLATVVEAAWEVLENSPLIIDRYRAVTMAWGYAGDSVLNSVSDIACMAAGFSLASRLPARWSIVAVLALELVALAAIRDNLTLNLLMLVAPIDAVRVWQAG